MEDSRTVPHTKAGPSGPLFFSLWLSWRELSSRRLAFAINVVLVAMLIALAVSVDAVGRARKGSVDKKIDYMGPSMSLVPAGVTSADLVRARLGNRTISMETYFVLKKDLGDNLRASEVRLTASIELLGRKVPVVGIDPGGIYSYPFSLYEMKGQDALLGEVLASKLSLSAGDKVSVGDREFSVKAIIPTTGGVDDLSIFVPLIALQDITGKMSSVNEIRVFPSDHGSNVTIKDKISKYYEQLSVIDSYRGEVAERDVDVELSMHQMIVYAVAFVLVAFCVLIGTYINIDGRKGEISTVFTLGATRGVVFQVLTYRIIWIAITGSFIGHFIAILMTLAYDGSVRIGDLWALSSFFYVTAATVILGLFVAVPFTYYSVYKRDLIEHL
ncbi:MAG: hypothetical protein JSV21_03380 [Nitrospirota bacterium]|nr:MAG: hypothetical protein JSV21_03380 [Nitrospirota bacterium]